MGKKCLCCGKELMLDMGDIRDYGDFCDMTCKDNYKPKKKETFKEILARQPKMQTYWRDRS